jgi:lipoate---protein ligase
MSEFKTEIYTTSCLNPYLNLAIEDWLFRTKDNTQILFLWRSTPSIVMGRFQNPWLECNTEQILHDKVNLVRRQSGGGTVYHDVDNLNFTFISPKESYNKDANNKIVVDALKDFGIEAFASGRNDILVKIDGEDRKISGSAFKQIKNMSFHHGTLLVKSDLTRLNNYLKPRDKVLSSKSIKSVRSKVANISEISNYVDIDTLIVALKDNFNKYYRSTSEIVVLEEKECLKIEHVNSYFKFLKGWEWIFGETPKFTLDLNIFYNNKNLIFKLLSHKGVIKELTGTEEYLMEIEKVSSFLLDVPFREVDIESKKEYVLSQCKNKELIRLVIDKIIMESR